MVGLLDLPLELREPILLDVVVDTIEKQPETPFELSKFKGYRTVFTHGGLFCKSLRRDARALLHINQQIRAEVVDLVLRKLAQRTDDARLDLVFEDRTNGPFNLWATWLSAPFRAYHLHTLHTQVRYLQVKKAGTRTNFPHVFRLSNTEDCCEWANGPTADRLLWFLAESLRTEAGKASIHRGRRKTRSTITGGDRLSLRTIQKLAIDIPVDPISPNSRNKPVRCMECHQTYEGTSLRMVPSGKRAALLLAKSMHKILMWNLHDVAGTPEYYHGTDFRPIFERIGTIDLNVDGRLFENINLSQLLAETPLGEQWLDSPFRRTNFFDWKRAAERQRKAAGFKSVNTSVQECHLAGPAGLIGSILAARDDSLLGEFIGPSEKNVETPGQPAADEQVAFTGKAVLVHEDGSKLSGDATFYCPSDMSWEDSQSDSSTDSSTDTISLGPPPKPFSDLQNCLQPSAAYDNFCNEFSVGKPLPGDRPRKGELVLFEGEAIVFPEARFETIISGDATFYGRAEEVDAKQSPDST